MTAFKWSELNAARLERKTAPFIKWAGGKRSSVEWILPALQAGSDKGRYYEPFLGGGAVFFALKPRWAVLSDVNGRLVDTYVGVKFDVERVIGLLKKCRYEKEYYLKIREQFNEGGPNLDQAVNAARFIFLNRVCFNGLYRVNKKGAFNVPFGRYTNPTICDEVGLKEASAALASATIGCRDFEVSLRAVQKGDRVYIDPPYTPVSDTASFTAYTKGGFGPKDQARLVACIADVAGRGALVVVSAADTSEVRALYKKRLFNLEEIKVRRAINSDASKRGAVGELLITPKKGAF